MVIKFHTLHHPRKFGKDGPIKNLDMWPAPKSLTERRGYTCIQYKAPLPSPTSFLGAKSRNSANVRDTIPVQLGRYVRRLEFNAFYMWPTVGTMLSIVLKPSLNAVNVKSMIAFEQPTRLIIYILMIIYICLFVVI